MSLTDNRPPLNEVRNFCPLHSMAGFFVFTNQPVDDRNNGVLRMALKQFYANESDVPTEQKSFYALKDGKYELQIEGVNSITGVMAKNSELLNQHTADKTELTRLNGEVGRLSADNSRLQSSAIPTGHVAVTKKESDFLEGVKKQNLKFDDVLNDIKEVPVLRSKVADSELEKSILEFAKTENISNVEALTKLIKQDGVKPVVKEVEEKGKKLNKGFLLSKDADGKDLEHTYGDYKSKNWSAFVPALETTTTTTRVGSQGDPAPVGTPTMFDEIRKSMESQNKVTVPDINTRFGMSA